jgi:hypothetical protein
MMMRVTGSVIALLFAVVRTLFAQFEGIVESKNLTTDEMGERIEYTMSMWVGNGVMRIQNKPAGDAPGTTLIYRNDKRVIWMINDEDKTYIEISKDEQARELLPPPPSPKQRRPVVSEQNVPKKILGYPCTQVIVTRGDEVTEIWGTKVLGGLSVAIREVLGDEHSSVADDWTDVLRRRGIYPLVAKTKIKGKVVESQEVTRVERKKLAQELFELPAGYKKQTTGTLFDNIAPPDN